MLTPHHLQLVLVHPQIAPNTGNIARLCVATGTYLHIVRPMGFVLSDRQLKSSAMDYWPRLKLTVHDDLDAFLQILGNGRVWLLENGSGQTIWDADFADGDWLLLGSETTGLPRSLRERYPDSLIAIPQVEGERCLNVSTAAGIGLFAALRAINAR
jgi:tRNA (cytidine/uridine-2'-O-)-methyltransferase